MARCVEVEWHGKGVFSGAESLPEDWQSVLDHAAAIRLLEVVNVHGWDAIYEVDIVDRRLGEPQVRTVQYLVEASGPPSLASRDALTGG